jgi:3-hydroxyisobutyrate dehydrogenase-like beta-hydroxyacid dehydrogenase
VIVGLVHPGEMGAAVGDALVANGHEVLWAAEGRSDETHRRAAAFRDVGALGAVAAGAEVIVSVVPPHAALAIARELTGFDGIYVDANAVSPATAAEIRELHPRFVDGGIVGGPPRNAGTTRLYLTGDEADAVVSLFDGGVLEAVRSHDASALKMTYAAWSKGTAALVLAIREVARECGVEEELTAEWARSVPELAARLEAAERSAATKGWRWIFEMEQIADTFAAAGQPDGFHRAAAQVYRG